MHQSVTTSATPEDVVRATGTLHTRSPKVLQTQERERAGGLFGNMHLDIKTGHGFSPVFLRVLQSVAVGNVVEMGSSHGLINLPQRVSKSNRVQ
jgi:hypothetical protein